jgi:ATP-dependent Clp protease ATP-binding subunit ClpA
VVDKFTRELQAQLVERRVALELTEAARHLLAKRGYDPDFGARPLARLLEEEIKRPLADAMLFGDLTQGGTAHIDAHDEVFVLNFAVADTAAVLN